VQAPIICVRRIRRSHSGSASFPCQIPTMTITPMIPYSTHASFAAIGEGVKKTRHKTMIEIQTRPNPAKNLRRSFVCRTAQPLSRPPYIHQPGFLVGFFSSSLSSGLIRRSLLSPSPDELERRLQERLDALGPAPRSELLHVLMLPDFDRVDRIGEF
jgi:hypothetical protein